MTQAKLAAAFVLLAACSDVSSTRTRFDAKVLPILERSCAAASCHGVAPDAVASGEQVDWEQFVFSLDARGAIADPEQAYRAAKRVINTREDPAFSSLLRKPLGVDRGGLPHYGGASFSGTDDAAYRAIFEWISHESEGGEDPEPLDEREQLFADTVQPVLVAGTCMTSRCHGPTAGGIPYALDLGYRGAFSAAATRHNYEQTLRMVTLDGFPLGSRVVRKAQPLGAGIVHKGENFEFFAGDPGGGVEAITAWICAERRARTGRGCASAREPAITGFVFVRGPVTPHHAFELDTFTPGSDLVLATVDDDTLVPSKLENLTAALHPEGLADVRDPSVSRDGRRVLFSMRTAADRGHHLWLLDLDTREAKQLTRHPKARAGGSVTSDRDPTWGPDDSVWFVSTREGHLADQGRLLDAELYSLDVESEQTRRWTYTPHVERKPVFFDIGDEAGGEVAFSVLRDAIPGQARAHIFRFPPSQRTEYHQHFGVTPVETFFYDMRELPDGRYVTVVGELPAPFGAGKLAIVDRNFGPEINARSVSDASALERYEPPMIVLGGEGVFRDPAPLPDGRILVAHAPTALDGADDTAGFAPRIELLELSEAADGTGPTVRRSHVLLAEPGVALTDPEPISLRAPVRPDGEALAPSDETTALFRHQGLPMIDGLLANLSPSGAKTPRDGVAYVRLIEHLPLAPSERAPLPAGDPSGAALVGTTAALGPHGPSRILAELPVAADGSFQARVPAGTSFRVQALDKAQMAIGVMHNRWYYTLPGQVLTQGISTATGTARYGSQCAACHGDPDGRALPPVLEPPDAVTAASLSLSRFERQDPRRPIDAPQLGAATRIEVDFEADVQPILERRCVACHGGEDDASAPDFSAARTRYFTRAYESLLARGAGSGGGRAYIDDGDGRARTSHLMELITGRELDAPRALPAGALPHPARADGTSALTDAERLTLIRWIDLGATFRGTAGKEPKP